MKFAVNALIWTPNFDASCFGLLPKVRANGFDGFEVPFFEPSKVAAGEIRRALSENGLQCNGCCLLPERLSPISEDAAVRRKTCDHLRECVRVTAEMGARLMCGPVYAPVGYLPGRRRTQDEWK